MGTRVYVGNLPADVREGEIDDIFARYGRIKTLDVKGGRDGAARFAFLEYEDPRDARDAVDRENGQDFAGGRMRVELARGGRDRFDDRGGGYDDRRGGYGGGGGYDDRRGGYDDRGGRPDDRFDDRRRGTGLGPSPYGPSRKTDYAVEVSGLDPSMSWQDLKDHFRTFQLEVTHADVDRRGHGSAMFASRQDMEDALSKVDGSEMKNMRGSCIVQVDPERGAGGGGGSRGRSRSRSPAGYRDDRGGDRDDRGRDRD